MYNDREREQNIRDSSYCVTVQCTSCQKGLQEKLYRFYQKFTSIIYSAIELTSFDGSIATYESKMYM